ncbi:putative nephrin-like [Penaeus vannamei]|uniref:Putative nephrin-like n=1 Tax=Penaeus vannamei TaxID=6689 RepID=A0A3R7MHD1_PENVA|nr:putative nephrin-like [Penaeus vannamei]
MPTHTHTHTYSPPTPTHPPTFTPPQHTSSPHTHAPHHIPSPHLDPPPTPTPHPIPLHINSPPATPAHPHTTLPLSPTHTTQHIPPHTEKNHGLVSVSELLVNVTRADDNTRVKCTAENPAVPGAVLSNFTTLTVHYPPSVTASLGRSLRPDLLKEGDDVYFTCSVAANPPASTITWYHEEENIQHGQALLHPSLLPQGTVQVQNVSQGVIVSGESLVLQKVRRDKAGKYKCGASNALATVTSAPVHLKIRYFPLLSVYQRSNHLVFNLLVAPPYSPPQHSHYSSSRDPPPRPTPTSPPPFYSLPRLLPPPLLYATTSHATTPPSLTPTAPPRYPPLTTQCLHPTAPLPLSRLTPTPSHTHPTTQPHPYPSHAHCPPPTPPTPLSHPSHAHCPPPPTHPHPPHPSHAQSPRVMDGRRGNS